MLYTPNYNLTQWEFPDRVLMESFNADNAKIDAALKAQANELANQAAKQAAALSDQSCAQSAALAAKAKELTDALNAQAAAQSAALAAKAKELTDALNAQATAQTNALNARAKELTTAQNNAISPIQTAVSSLQTAVTKLGNCQLYTTSYPGKNTYGESSPNTLTFPLKPILVTVYGDREAFGFFPYGVTSLALIVGTMFPRVKISWSGNTLSWYSTANSPCQLNYTGITYYVVAFLQKG